MVMSSWEVLLSKGQEWDWLDDPFGKVQTLLVLFVLVHVFEMFAAGVVNGMRSMITGRYVIRPEVKP